MNAAMISPVMMTAINPNNYTARRDTRKKAAVSRKKKDESRGNAYGAALYEPTDEETRMRGFYATYGR